MSINKFYNDSWTESSSSERIPKCKIKVFKNRTHAKGRLIVASSSTHEQYYNVDVDEFFEITYFKFNSEADYNANRHLIGEMFNNMKIGNLDYFSSKDTHIVFHTYAMNLNQDIINKYGREFDGYIFSKDFDSDRILKRAAKFTELKR